MGLGFRFKNKVDGVNGIVVLMKRDEMANIADAAISAAPVNIINLRIFIC